MTLRESIKMHITIIALRIANSIGLTDTRLAPIVYLNRTAKTSIHIPEILTVLLALEQFTKTTLHLVT